MNRLTPHLGYLCVGMILMSSRITAADDSVAPPPQTTSIQPSLGQISTRSAPVDQASTPQGFWDQDALTGNWGGLHKTLKDDGIELSPTYTGEVIGNPSGGKKQGIVTEGLFNVQLDFNLERMTDGGVDGLTIHANAIYVYGPLFSQQYVGDFSGAPG